MIFVWEENFQCHVAVNDATVLLVACFWNSGKRECKLDRLNTIRDLLLAGF